RDLAFVYGTLADALAAGFLREVCPLAIEPAELWEAGVPPSSAGVGAAHLSG
ncbi:MAG: hypothetical protein GY842_14200, partial [bacterium]|nr:hypothetical protein [bacterium]